MPFPIEDFIVAPFIQGATQAVSQAVFIAPWDLDVVKVQVRFSAGSTSGVLDVMTVPDGTAVGSGTSILSSTVDISTGKPNDTLQTAALKGLETGLQRISKGSALGLKFTGTVTNIANLSVTIWCRQVKKF